MSLNNMDNDWKKEAPKLAAMGRINPFSVPEGYFESLHGQISSQVYLSDLHPGSATGKFTVPEGYFETLTAQIEGQIVVERLKEEFVDNHFTVPEEYFSTLQNRINTKIEEPAKVISIWPRKRLAWISYAAAACITLALSVTFYFNTSTEPVISSQVANTAADISSVPDEDIIEYLQQSSTRADLPVLIEKVGENIASPAIDADISNEQVQSYINKL